MSTEKTQTETSEQVETTEDATTSEETVAKETQAEDNDAEETEDESGEETAEEKPKKGIQKRFSELTAQRKAAEAYAQRLEEHNRTLMEFYQKQQQPAQPPAPNVPQSMPDRYDFDDDAKYQQAVDVWMDAQFQRRIQGLQEQAKQRQSEESRRKQQEDLTKTLESMKAKGSTQYEDFDDTAYVPNGLVAHVVLAENAHEIAYRWGKKPEEARELLALAETNPQLAALKIGRIDAEISLREKKQTSAPPPVKPVGGRAEGTVDPDKMSTAEWMAWREKQLKK